MKFTTLIICLLSLIPAVKAQLPANLFSISDTVIEQKVDSIYNSLTTKERIAQMIFIAAGDYGRKTDEVQNLVSQRKVGGIIYLGGTAAEFKEIGESVNKANNDFVPLLYSIDAEPSLIKYKLRNVADFAKTNTLKDSVAVVNAVSLINSMLNDVEVTINYAPVCDLTPENEVIGHRSFGKNEDTVVMLSQYFIDKSLQGGVLPVIKHFPGHGNVVGDSHKKLVYIDGEMQELNTFKRMINNGAPSVMVGHIAIQNNEFETTMPSSLSHRVVTDLLRDSLNFSGLIITDALNMGAVSSIKNAGFLAMQAGCDVILMPLNVDQVIDSAYIKVKEDENFALQIESSVKRILKLKYAQGLIH
ncbi:MAG: glycoside hydrolase family 3 N-terminal domain-containing protein [Bacteroidia bacterium]